MPSVFLEYNRLPMKTLFQIILGLLFVFEISWSALSEDKSSPASDATLNQLEAESPKALPFDIKEIKSGTVYFSKEGVELETPFHQLGVLGKMNLEVEGVPPYYLFSALPCGEPSCKERRLVFLVRADGQVKTTFVYPGKVRDRKSRRLLLDSRAFFGKCLPSKGEIFIVFQKEKLDRRRGLRRSVYLAEVGKDRIHEKLIIRRRPRLRHVIRQVKRKTCEEIKGFNRLTMGFKIPPPQKLSKEEGSKI